MSFIHCSPLFTPLMPLPTMSPEAMRNQRKNSAGSTTNPSTASMKPPSTKRKTSSSSAKLKGKQPVASTRRASHPLSEPPACAAPSYASEFQPPPLSTHVTTSAEPDTIVPESPMPEHRNSTELDFSYPEHVHGRPALVESSSYQNSFDSEIQASLTLTLESQPMSDLSSSQQLNT